MEQSQKLKQVGSKRGVAAYDDLRLHGSNIFKQIDPLT